MKKSFLHTSVCTFCFIILFLSLSLNSLTQFANSQSSVFTDVLRLHIIACSDSESDQLLKLKVRDNILDAAEKLFKNCTNIESALEIAKQNRTLLKAIAQNTVNRNGSQAKVNIKISKEHYPEKVYGKLTFPSGEYLSVRIILGKGEGQNWWCVLFPPLCNAGVIDSADTLLNYGFKKDEVQMLEGKNIKGINIFGTNVSLKIFELFSQEKAQCSDKVTE